MMLTLPVVSGFAFTSAVRGARPETARLISSTLDYTVFSVSAPVIEDARVCVPFAPFKSPGFPISIVRVGAVVRLPFGVRISLEIPLKYYFICFFSLVANTICDSTSFEIPSIQIVHQISSVFKSKRLFKLHF